MTMFPTMTELDQAHERLEGFAAEAIRTRRERSRASSLRRAVGLRVAALGLRLAGQHSFELARSR
jgi:hypothetical protein